MAHGWLSAARLQLKLRDVLVCLMGCVLANGALAQANPVIAPPAKIQLLIDQAVNEGNIPGAVAMFGRSGHIDWIATAGFMAPQVPMADNAIMPLASVGKMFTATACMILLERGLLALDDPVSKFIPEFANVSIWVEVQPGVRKLVPPDRPITLFHLLTHSAGLSLTGEGFWAAWNRHVGSTTTTHLAEELALTPLVSQPGQEFAYGQTGASYEVLGAVIEIVSGQTLEAFLSANLFEPLQLQATSFYIPEHHAHRLPAVYRNSDDGLQLERAAGQDFPRSTFFHGGGGVRSSASDLFRFASLFLNNGVVGGTRILQPQTVELMMGDHLGELAPEPWKRRGLSWGFGAAVEYNVDADGERRLKKYGWVGGGFAKLWIDMQHQSVSYLAFPLTPPGDNALLAEFERLIYQSDSGS